MATLKIISESQLIRGPLIGSGAFGSVFCGVWRPSTNTGAPQHQQQSPFDTGISLPDIVITPSGSINNTTKTSITYDYSQHQQQPQQRNQQQPASAVDEKERLLKNVSTHQCSQQDVRNQAVTDAANASIAIPVAIKILSDTPNPKTNKELLEEAKVGFWLVFSKCIWS